MFPEEQFHFATVVVPSGVAEQPTSDAETLMGARNRALHARSLHATADFWVGIEGGIEDQNGGMLAFAWVVVCTNDGLGKSRTGAFVLPEAVAELVRQGKELGEADDLVFGRANSKQEEGAVGLLTGNVIDRAGLYEQAVILALIPFRPPAKDD